MVYGPVGKYRMMQGNCWCTASSLVLGETIALFMNRSQRTRAWHSECHAKLWLWFEKDHLAIALVGRSWSIGPWCSLEEKRDGHEGCSSLFLHLVNSRLNRQKEVPEALSMKNTKPFLLSSSSSILFLVTPHLPQNILNWKPCCDLLFWFKDTYFF